MAQIEAYCQGFTTFPARGKHRDDVRDGLRVVGFKRRVTIAFHIELDSVVFDRIFYAGRDTDRALN